MALTIYGCMCVHQQSLVIKACLLMLDEEGTGGVEVKYLKHSHNGCEKP